ncbi:MAG TPA: NAD(P)/FAD-dependent oxidoreductase [Acidimicrobiia bacterium]|jgi:cyclohexanone monooxygenase
MPTPAADLDAVVVGAGFAGLYMLHRLRTLGLSARVFDRAAGVGGTWYWNRYPGARCDVESLHYSYSFDPDLEREWNWTERYAAQPEILAYANHVADRFGLRDGIRLETAVRSAAFDEATGAWTVETDPGGAVTARFLVLATGCLSDAQVPAIPGLETFAGHRYHTGRWPHEGVDFTDQRVAVIGTGSSGIQSIPAIAAEAAHTYVLQRTPNFSIPANNAPLDPSVLAKTQANYGELREKIWQSPLYFPVNFDDRGTMAIPDDEFRAIVERRWERGGLGVATICADILLNEEASERVAGIVREKIRAKVDDPAVAERLIPTTYPFGSKRLCLDTGYFETFNRHNVTLIDLRESPITGIVPEGVTTTDGTIEVDAIVFATGFDAMTGTILRIPISGRGGLTIQEKWSGGPVTYLGLAVHGFPNLFTITGPGSPSVLTNMIPSIEQHVDWIADCLVYLDGQGLGTIEADEDAEKAWTDQVHALGDMTIFPKGNSWYMGRNIEGKPVGFMPFVGGAVLYRQICDGVAQAGYQGFHLS